MLALIYVLYPDVAFIYEAVASFEVPRLGYFWNLVYQQMGFGGGKSHDYREPQPFDPCGTYQCIAACESVLFGFQR